MPYPPLPLAAYQILAASKLYHLQPIFRVFYRELSGFYLIWSKSGEILIFSIVTAGKSCIEGDDLQLLPIFTIPKIVFIILNICSQNENFFLL